LSIEGIIQRIQKDATAEAERIRQEYASQIAELDKVFQSETEAALQRAEQKFTAERENARRRAIEHEKLVQSQIFLAKKLDIINSLFVSVREKIENLPDAEYRILFADVLMKLGEADGTIIVAADAKILDNRFLELAKDRIKSQSGREPGFSLQSIKGNWRGFYLDRGKTRYNATLDALIATVREKAEGMIIEKLFGKSAQNTM